MEKFNKRKIFRSSYSLEKRDLDKVVETPVVTLHFREFTVNVTRLYDVYDTVWDINVKGENKEIFLFISIENTNFSSLSTLHVGL